MLFLNTKTKTYFFATFLHLTGPGEQKNMERINIDNRIKVRRKIFSKYNRRHPDCTSFQTKWERADDTREFNLDKANQFE